MLMETTSTREKYPDDSLPGWLIELRNGGSYYSALSAAFEGAEARTREIARERLEFLKATGQAPKL